MSFVIQILMSAAQAVEGVSTRVSTLLVLTSVSVEMDTHCPAIINLVMVCIYITYILYIMRYWYTISDINECTSRSHNCVQVCTNTAGSFTCSCNSGYTLAADGRSCSGMLFSIDIDVKNDHIYIDMNECKRSNWKLSAHMCQHCWFLPVSV